MFFDTATYGAVCRCRQTLCLVKLLFACRKYELVFAVVANKYLICHGCIIQKCAVNLFVIDATVKILDARVKYVNRSHIQYKG